MRDHDVDARDEGPGVAAAVNEAAPVARKHRTRRSWKVEDKVRIVRESYSSGETIAAVAQRHGITRRLVSSWRTQLREGKLVAPSLAQTQPGGAFAAVEVEERSSVVIEGRDVTVRLEGIADTAGMAAIVAALAGGA